MLRFWITFAILFWSAGASYTLWGPLRERIKRHGSPGDGVLIALMLLTLFLWPVLWPMYVHAEEEDKDDD